MLKNLKTLREQHGISQQKLADAISMSQSSINDYENRGIEPDISTLSALAVFFDTSVDFIIGRTDIRHQIEPVEETALNADEKEILTQYRNLLPNQRKSLKMFMDTLSGV